MVGYSYKFGGQHYVKMAVCNLNQPDKIALQRTFLNSLKKTSKSLRGGVLHSCGCRHDTYNFAINEFFLVVFQEMSFRSIKTTLTTSKGYVYS